MCESVNQSSHQHLILYDFSPSIKGEVCRNEGGLGVSPKREVVEEHVHPLHACLYDQGCRYMCLSRTGVSIKDDISVLMYEVQRFQPWQQVLDSLRQLVPVQLLQTGTLLS